MKKYSIISVTYVKDTRQTCVTIVDKTTGKTYTGTARRHPSDYPDQSLGTRLAFKRAIQKAILEDFLHGKELTTEELNLLLDCQD